MVSRKLNNSRFFSDSVQIQIRLKAYMPSIATSYSVSASLAILILQIYILHGSDKLTIGLG